MIRPFSVIGAAAFTAVAVSSFVGVEASLILSAVFAVGFVLVSVSIKNKHSKILISTIFAVMILGMAANSLYTISRISPIEKFCSDECRIVCYESAVAQKTSYGYKYKFKAESINGEDKSFKFVVNSSSMLDFNSDEKVYIKGVLDKNTNTSECADGYNFKVKSLKEVSPAEGERPWSIRYAAEEFRNSIIEKFKKYLPEDELSIISAMLLGERSALDQDINDDFSEIGVSHLFAVSGVHVSVIGGFAYLLLSKFRINKRSASVAASVFVLFYMVLTGLSMSVIRGGIMMIMLFLSNVFKRKGDALNTLGAATALICLFDPPAVASVSFLLSASATLGVLTLGMFLCRRYKDVFGTGKVSRILSSVLNTVLVSFSVVVFTFPVMAVCFSKINFFSLFTNIVFIPIATFFINCAAVACLFIWLPVIAYPLTFVCGLTARLMIFLSSAFADFPLVDYLSLNVGDAGVIFAAGVVFLFGLCLILFKNKTAFRAAAVCCSLLVVLTAFSFQYVRRNTLSVRVFDSSSVCVLLEYRSKSVLIGTADNYSSDKVVDNIKKSGLKEIDWLVFTRMNKVSSNFLESVNENFDVENALLPYDDGYLSGNFKAAHFYSKVSIDLDDGYSIQYIYDDKSSWTLVRFGETKIAVASDYKAEVEKLPQDFRDCDLVISASSVPESIHSQAAVIQTNKFTKEKALKSVYSSDLQNAAFTDGKDVQLDVNNNGEIGIKGESQWAQ